MRVVERVAQRYELLERVAHRYAASKLFKPEKFREILLKLRKGAGTSMKVSEVIRVLDQLGGWRIGEDTFLQYEPDYRREGEVHTVGERDEAHARSLWEKAKKDEVRTLPQNPQLHKHYTMDVSDLEQRGDIWAFKIKSWQGSMGVKLTTPSGSSAVAKVDPSAADRTYASLVFMTDGSKFWDWLNGPGKFLDQVNAFLGMESHEEEKARKKVDRRVEDNTGTCSCCFGVFKLSPKNVEGKDKTMPGMVLHGYKRPGIGYIFGNCFGIRYPPFELSAEGAVAWVQELEDTLEGREARLAKLEAGETVALLVNGKMVGRSETPPERWALLLVKGAIGDTKSQIDDIKRDIKQHRSAIASWTRKPLLVFGVEM